jgi:hypothetical protein
MGEEVGGIGGRGLGGELVTISRATYVSAAPKQGIGSVGRGRQNVDGKGCGIRKAGADGFSPAQM